MPTLDGGIPSTLPRDPEAALRPQSSPKRHRNAPLRAHLGVRTALRAVRVDGARLPERAGNQQVTHGVRPVLLDDPDSPAARREPLPPPRRAGPCRDHPVHVRHRRASPLRCPCRLRARHLDTGELHRFLHRRMRELCRPPCHRPVHLHGGSHRQHPPAQAGMDLRAPNAVQRARGRRDRTGNLVGSPPLGEPGQLPRQLHDLRHAVDSLLPLASFSSATAPRARPARGPTASCGPLAASSASSLPTRTTASSFSFTC